MAFGLLFFVYKLFVDSHVLLNVCGQELESSGKLVQNACRKVIIALAFYQVAMFLKFFGERKTEAYLILFFLFSFTCYIYSIYGKPFLNPDIFLDDQIRISEETLERWYKMYSHPLMNDAKYSRLVKEAYSNAIVIPHNKLLIDKD